MTGAECLLRTLLANGVELCFANPGTSEMQFVAALDRVSGMRAVLNLFEGVCSGAADGYARMAGRPAATLLHLGPGLANALSNLHNARKGRTPVVNIVGEHSTAHLELDAPLEADIEGFARPVSAWVRTVDSEAGIGAATSEAVRAALDDQVATLIVPADFSWSESGPVGAAVDAPARGFGDVEAIRRVLDSGTRAAVLLGGRALLRRGQDAAARLGVPVFANRYSARMTRGGGQWCAQRLPYFPEAAAPLLAEIEDLILVESAPPVSFFGYPNTRGLLTPEGCRFHVLAAPGENGTAALEALAGDRAMVPRAAPPLPELPSGELTADAIGRILSHRLPGGAIVSDESVSSNAAIWPHLGAAAEHDHLPVTGGSIGQGLPVALGSALACPERRVVALEADGSAMYSFQALWSMARENTDVTVVILANQRYRILDVEMERTGSGPVGPKADALLDLRRPEIDWVRMSEGMGVAAGRASTCAEFDALFSRSIRQRGPMLIEASIP